MARLSKVLSARRHFRGSIPLGRKMAVLGRAAHCPVMRCESWPCWAPHCDPRLSVEWPIGVRLPDDGASPPDAWQCFAMRRKTTLCVAGLFMAGWRDVLHRNDRHSEEIRSLGYSQVRFLRAGRWCCLAMLRIARRCLAGLGVAISCRALQGNPSVGAPRFDSEAMEAIQHGASHRSAHPGGPARRSAWQCNALPCFASRRIAMQTKEIRRAGISGSTPERRKRSGLAFCGWASPCTESLRPAMQ